jgi:NodT family efflux transporter outer membrane factor (OMF) lipoprotein
VAAVIGIVVLGGCASKVGPDYAAPEATVPATWTEAANSRFVAFSTESTAGWWREFNDPVLDDLIARALEHGPDWRETIARLREARALRGVAGAERFPTLGADAAYQHSGDSTRTALGAFATDADLHTLGLDAAWELDLWGRVRRLNEAADADYAAAIEDAQAVALSVAAETALNYVELRAFQQRAAIAQTNVRLQEQTLELVEARFDAGLVGERDVAQAASNLQVTRARLPSLEAGWRAAQNRLAVLLGLAPGELAAELELLKPIPVPPATIAIDLPADAVRQRPDVRQAERVLAAEHARIGVAQAELYPRLALGGSLGVAAENASDLFRSGSDFFGVGPSVRWRLFEGGRLRQRVEAQHARTEQAFVRWERTVLTALEETENAMTGFLRAHAQRSALLEAATQARRAVELAEFEYREGLSDFQAVLDSQRALAVLEDELAQTDGAIATQVVALHKALGDA